MGVEWRVFNVAGILTRATRQDLRENRGFFRSNHTNSKTFGENQSKMWKLIVLSGVILTRFGHSASQKAVPDGNNGTSVSVLPPRKIAEIKCGERTVNGAGADINGIVAGNKNQALFGEFPWMVAILPRDWKSRKNPFISCGGSLIHPKAVLTAARCLTLETESSVMIRAGEWNIRSTSERLPHQDRFVEKIVYPDSLDPSLYSSSLAILILKEPFEIAPHVNVVCLPQIDHPQCDQSRCIATGWGKNVTGRAGRRQTILKKVELPIVPNCLCQPILRNVSAYDDLVLNESHLCAGGESGVGICGSDIGGPLVCGRQFGSVTRYILTGILVWLVKCFGVKVPATFSNVAYVREWINKTLLARNLTTPWNEYST